MPSAEPWGQVRKTKRVADPPFHATVVTSVSLGFLALNMIAVLVLLSVFPCPA